MGRKEDELSFIKPIFGLTDDKDLFILYYHLSCRHEDTIRYYESLALKNGYDYNDINRSYSVLLKTYDGTSKEREELILKVFSPYKIDFLLNYCFLKYVSDPKCNEMYKKLRKIAIKNKEDAVYIDLAFHYLDKLFKIEDISNKKKESFIEKVFAPIKVNSVLSNLGSLMITNDPEYYEVIDYYTNIGTNNGYNEISIDKAIGFVGDLLQT